ncbi:MULTISPECIES: flagellar export chaperone FliS [Piscirickettsiaceae]|jgi:flagellar protein FliS|uniref:Flagellar secretion chaperone FliS n=1 Tax=Hydrogenovibrio thermophilus TaxID=265883 RepID=A0A410H5T4_9GAMM|nr:MULTISPECIES: flagellar protein FliS [Piscirickettsiaceae]AZR81028.1 flagellar protein FliS [Thiomicrospira sp. S5]QAB16279.1 flagellar protein FliS [Hydrogenovibrio thermophilus]
MTTNHNMATEVKAPILQEYNKNPNAESHLADNPSKTILLLLQGVVDKGNLAKVCHQSNALVEKGFHLGRMTTILDALRDRLSLTQNSPLAFDLDELYRYADKSIQEAVFEKDTFYLDSAIEILTEVRDAWLEMMQQSGQVAMDD